MERAVFVIAVVVAAVIGIGAILNGIGPQVIEIKRHHIEAEEVYEGAAESLAAQTYAAHSISLDYAAAHVVVSPEDRDDIVIEIENPGNLPTPQVSLARGEIKIDGRLRGRTGDCGPGRINVRGYGALNPDELPQIRLRTPMAVKIEADGASFVEIGAAREVEFANHGCGQVNIGDVAEKLDLEFAGVGNVKVGEVGSLDLELPGVGQVELEAVNGPATIQIYGAGRVRVGRLSGALDGEMAGAGSLFVDDGRLTIVSISIGGAGEFALRGGQVDEMDVEIGGSGQVRAPGPVRRLDVEMGGAGLVEIDGEVGDLRAEIAGVGQVRADRVTGRLEQEVVGPGGVRVGR